jgi:hypothetical protein
LEWWKTELNSLANKIEQEKDIDSRQMYRRRKGFLGIVCYSYTTKALSENHLELANKCIGIYEIVEPKNPDCFFYKAVLFEKKNQAGDAAVALKKALEFGFKDTGKMRKEISKKTLKLANIPL